jgi:hypothetical protein
MPESNDLATKQDLLQLEDRLTEKMRDMQTEMLRAFHHRARPSEIKLRCQSATIAALEERISLLEERLYDAERGSKTPVAGPTGWLLKSQKNQSGRR